MFFRISDFGFRTVEHKIHLQIPTKTKNKKQKNIKKVEKSKTENRCGELRCVFCTRLMVSKLKTPPQKIKGKRKDDKIRREKNPKRRNGNF